MALVQKGQLDEAIMQFQEVLHYNTTITKKLKEHKMKNLILILAALGLMVFSSCEQLSPAQAKLNYSRSLTDVEWRAQHYHMTLALAEMCVRQNIGFHYGHLMEEDRLEREAAAAAH